MTLPVTTRPTTLVQSYAGVPPFLTKYDSQTHTVQKAPFNLILPYERKVGTSVWSPNSGLYIGTPTAADQIVTLLYDQNRMNRVANKCYEKLKDKVYKQAALGLNLVESRQAFGMVESRAKQLSKFTLQLVRRQFSQAAATLGLAAVPRGVSVKKSFAANFLEFHFGWEPLFQDIYDFLEVWNKPVRVFDVERASAGERTTENYDRDFGQNTLRKGSVVVSYTSGQGFRVKAITDANLHSLDEWGVLNPLTLVWEVIPFSFVIDWFVNVGQVLASFSDYAGMTVEYPFHVTKYTTSLSALYYNPVNPGEYKAMRNVATGSWTTRRAGLYAPTFAVKQLRFPSKTRATTAISLLVQQLKSGGKYH